MSRLSQHHQQLNELGEGKCSVPMWCCGVPADFCDRPAYGERPPGKTHVRWDGHQYRDDHLYPGYVPGLACPIHGGPKVRTFMDGNAWCAVNPDFINLQESAVGFGDTREAAIRALSSIDDARIADWARHCERADAQSSRPPADGTSQGAGIDQQQENEEKSDEA